MIGSFQALQRRLCYLRPAPAGLSREEHLAHERYRRILWSGAAATAAKLVSALVGVVTVPMVVSHVGKEQFGLWMVVSSLVVWLQLTDFGIGNGIANALAEANGRDDAEAASGYLSTAFATLIGVAALCLPILYVAYLWLPWKKILNISSPELDTLAADALLVVGLAFVINIPLSLVGRVYVAYQRSDYSNGFQVLASIGVFIGLWLGVRAELGLLWLVGISASVPVFVNLLLLWALPKAGIQLSLEVDRVSRKFLSRVAASSVPMFLFLCGALLVNQLVNVVIANLLNLQAVADYSVIQRLYLFVFSLASALSAPFYPAIREAFERGHNIWVRKAISRVLLVRLGAVALFLLPLIILGDYLMTSWLGSQNSISIGLGGWFIVCATLLLISAGSVFSDILMALDNIWFQVGIVFMNATITFAAMYFFLPRFGIVGVFISFSISSLPVLFLCRSKLKSFILDW